MPTSTNEENWGQILKILRTKTNRTVTEVALAAKVAPSTVLRAESGQSEPSISVYARMIRATGARLRIDEPEETAMTPSGPTPPTTYPNPRGDNPYDNDAVHWLLEQPGVHAAGWTRGTLMECLRRQPNRVRNQPDRVDEAARLAARYGVLQKEETDPRIGKSLVRLHRTDPGKPTYPGESSATR